MDVNVLCNYIHMLLSSTICFWFLKVATWYRRVLKSTRTSMLSPRSATTYFCDHGQITFQKKELKCLYPEFRHIDKFRLSIGSFMVFPHIKASAKLKQMRLLKTSTLLFSCSNFCFHLVLKQICSNQDTKVTFAFTFCY